MNKFTILSVAVGMCLSTAAFAQVQQGNNANAATSTSVALGNNTQALGIQSTAVGEGAQATKQNSTAVGAAAQATGNDSTAVGVGSVASGDQSYAVGGTASGLASVTLGNNSFASNDFAIAIGTGAQATEASSLAIGDTANASGRLSQAMGNSSRALGYGSLAYGTMSYSSGVQSVALGYGASAFADGCLALGSGSSCNESSEANFGNRRLTGLVGGVYFQDAATMYQLQSATNSFGGGASWSNGVFNAPVFTLKNVNYYTVDDALKSLDGRLTTVENNPGGGSPGPAGRDGIDGRDGRDGIDGRDGLDGRDGVDGIGQDGRDGIDGLNGLNGRSAYEVAVDDGFTGTQQEWLESLQGRDGIDGKDGLNGSASVAGGKNITTTTDDAGVTTISLNDNVQVSDRIGVEGGPALTRDGIDAAGRKITGVAAGSVSATSTDAVNGAQLYQVQQDYNDRWEATNRRMDRYDSKLNGLGAQMAAMSTMALAGGGGNDYVGSVKFVMGAGVYGNQAAGAMGWRVRASEKVVWAGSLTFGSGGAKVGGGIGFSVDLGN